MKVKLSAFPAIGNYRLVELGLDELASFEPQASCAACGDTSDPVPIARLGGVSVTDGLVLQACTHCAHVSYDRLPSNEWLTDFYARTWDEARRQKPPKLVRQRFLGKATESPWSYIPYFTSLGVSQEARILDFGCGFGHGLVALRQLGYQNLFGVEVGTHRFSVAQEQFPNRVVEGSIEAARALRERDGQFDVIVLNHVAEHLGEPLTALQHLAELLSDKGLLAVSVPNRGAESPIHLPLYFPHLHHFSALGLMDLLARVGLTPHRWVGSEVQLAVVGSSDPRFQQPSFVAEQPSRDPEACAAVGRYVAAPWSEFHQPRDPTCLNYFHPWIQPGSSGFKHLSPRSERWLSRVGRAFIPAVRAGEKYGLDNHNIGRRIVTAATRALGQDAPVGSDFIRCKYDVPVSSDEAALPWLVGSNANVPVLAK